MSKALPTMIKRAVLATKSFALCLMALSLLNACDNSKMRKLSDMELAEKAAECNSMNDPAPVLIQLCQNVKRECVRRQEDLNIFVC